MRYVCNPSTHEVEVGGSSFKASLSYIDPVSNRQSFTDVCLIHTTKQVPNLQMKQKSCLQEAIVLLFCFLCVHSFLCAHVCWGYVPMYVYESACGAIEPTAVLCSLLVFHLIF